MSASARHIATPSSFEGTVPRIAPLFFLVPPLAAVIGWLALGEAMPPLAWVGLALAAAGVALAPGMNAIPRLRR
ncbi:MAG: hypothetical protein M3Z20_18870 [Chloroflexota bacterium]|nr:hypothetical protein [Chloroflexota bacterium]